MISMVAKQKYEKRQRNKYYFLKIIQVFLSLTASYKYYDQNSDKLKISNMLSILLLFAHLKMFCIVSLTHFILFFICYMKNEFDI